MAELLIQPYRDLEEDQIARLNIDISRADLHLIKSIAPVHGILQSIVGLYIKSICDELRQNGTTSYTDTSYGTLNSIVSRRTAPGTPKIPDAPNDPGATTRTDSPTPNPKNKRPIAKSSTPNKIVGPKKTIDAKGRVS